MILSTFDKELYEKDLREEAFDEGALSKLSELVVHQLEQGKTAEQIAELFGESLDSIKNIIKNLRIN